MSIPILLVRPVARLTNVAAVVDLVKTAKLHLHPSRSELRVAEGAPCAAYLERHAILISADHPDLGGHLTGARIPFRISIPPSQLNGDQPARRAPPVPRLGQRPVDPRRGHL